MKERKGRQASLVLLIMTICLYVVFYSRIECRPNHAGFWIILIMGISFGIALTRFVQWFKESDNS
ncbi:MAG: hypothetical protein ABSA76_10590 [Bacteroidales bacterium]